MKIEIHISRTHLIIALAVIIALAGGVFLQFHSQNSAPSIQKFDGMVGNDNTGKDFASLIQNNDGKIIYLDIWIDEGNIFESSDLKGFTILDDCGMEFGCGGNEYLIYMGDISDAMFSHIPRDNAYRLKGYWSIMANTAFNQGISSNVLTAIPAKDAQKSVK